MLMRSSVYILLFSALFFFLSHNITLAQAPVRLEIASRPVFIDGLTEVVIRPLETGIEIEQANLRITANGVSQDVPVAKSVSGDYSSKFYPTAVSEYRYDVTGIIDGKEFKASFKCEKNAESILPCPVAKDAYAIPYPQRTLNDVLYTRPGVDEDLTRLLNRKFNTSTILGIMGVTFGALGFVVSLDVYRRSRVTKLDVLQDVDY